MFLFKIKLIVTRIASPLFPPLVVRNKIFHGSIKTNVAWNFLNKKCVSDKEERRERRSLSATNDQIKCARYYTAYIYVCRWRNADPATHTPLLLLFSPET
jgi:hypothetical protein